MMSCPPAGYIMFNLKKLTFHGGREMGPGTGYEDRGLNNPNTPYYFLSSANL